jgi:hypothetical protein
MCGADTLVRAAAAVNLARRTLGTRPWNNLVGML